jgi:hypothetical protein
MSDIFVSKFILNAMNKQLLVSLLLTFTLFAACESGAEISADFSEEPQSEETDLETPERSFSRDAQTNEVNSNNASRMVGLMQFQTGLEFYADDQDGNYFLAEEGLCVNEDPDFSSELSVYFTALPDVGEKGPNMICEDNFYYQSYAEGQAYVLAVEFFDHEDLDFASKKDVYCGIEDANVFQEASSFEALLIRLNTDEFICGDYEEGRGVFFLLSRASLGGAVK